MDTTALVKSYLSERIELEELTRELDRLPHADLQEDAVARRALRIIGEATSAHLDEDVIVRQLRRVVVPYEANRVRDVGAAAGIRVGRARHAGMITATVRPSRTDELHRRPLRVERG